jgi:hypothetical protein
MSGRKKWYPLARILFASCLLGGVLFALAPALLARRTCEVDVNSGKLRQRTWVLFVVVSEDVQETTISQNTSHDRVLPPDWRVVRSEAAMAFPRVIPWHRLHTTAKYAEVPVQLNMFRLLCKEKGLSPERKRSLAAEITSLWKRTGGDDEATVFLLRMFGARNTGMHSD